MAALNDVLRATLSGQIDAVDLFNLVFHYRVIAGAETDYDVIATAIAAALSVAFSSVEIAITTEVVSDTLTLWEWDFTGDEFDGKASVVTAALVGTNGGQAEPNGICAVWRWGTQELRRQARKFIPGMVEANIDNDALQSGILSPSLTAVALLNNDIVAGGLTLRPCTFNSTPLSPRFETNSEFSQTAFVNALVGYQRRRQPGSGA